MEFPGLSYWEKNSLLARCDVLVIGSGLVGLNAAIELKEQTPQLRVLVLERGPLPLGASTRNAGFACFGSMSELLDDLTRHNETEVFNLVAKRWQGLQALRRRLGDQNIDYQALGNYELFRPEDTDVYERCLDQQTAFNHILKTITGQNDVYIQADDQLKGFGFQGFRHALLNRAEGQIDTGKMMQQLLRLAREQGVEVLNGLEVMEIEETDRGVQLQLKGGWQVEAGKVLVATNGFVRQFWPDLEVAPARNQVLITKELPGLAIQGCFHYDRGYFYFRNIHNRILLGGGRHLAPGEETTDAFGNTPLIQEALQQLLENHLLPDRPVEIDYWWSGILGIGTKKEPLIQMVSPRIGVAVRLGGMGVAIGTLIGQEGAQMLQQA